MSEVERLPLTDVLEFREGPGILAKDFRDEGVPLLRLAGLKSGASLLDGCNYLDPDMVRSKWNHFAVRAGDTLLSTSASLGEVARADESAVGAVPYTGIIAFRPIGDRMVSEFVPLALTERSFKLQIEAMGVGSVMRHFGPSHLKSMTVSVPPIAQQRAIAEVLGALDDKIAANTKLAQTAAALSDTIYDSSVAGLPTQPMSAMLQPILGGTPARAKAEYWGGYHLWISAKDVTGAPSGVVIDTEEKITDLAVTETKAKPLREGSVIITARGTVGAVARLAVPASFNQSCYGFEPATVPPSVLYMAILRATERAKAVAHGSVFDTITMRTFDHIGIPRLDEAATSSLEDRLRPLLDAVVACVKENGTLAATRNALLPQLMSGKLRVKDAEKVAAEVV